MFDLTILTPEKTFFKGAVQSLIAPGTIGYLEILRNHAPIVTLLKTGYLTVTDASNEVRRYLIANGVLEVHENRASLLTDSIEPSNQ